MTSNCWNTILRIEYNYGHEGSEAQAFGMPYVMSECGKTVFSVILRIDIQMTPIHYWFPVVLILDFRNFPWYSDNLVHVYFCGLPSYPPDR